MASISLIDILPEVTALRALSILSSRPSSVIRLLGICCSTWGRIKLSRSTSLLVNLILFIGLLTGQQLHWRYHLHHYQAIRAAY